MLTLVEKWCATSAAKETTLNRAPTQCFALDKHAPDPSVCLRSFALDQYASIDIKGNLSV